MIKGFFFDLDGTLINTYKADFLAYRDAIEEVVGIVIPEEDFNKTHGQEMRQKLQSIAPETSEEDAKKIAAQKKIYYQKYLHLTIANEDLIKFLAKYSIHNEMVIVTTAKKDNALSVLKKHKIDHYFTHMIFGEDVTESKPDPGAYLLALQKTGLKPNEVLAFEDSDAGIAAAEAANIPVVHVRDFIL